MVPLSLDSRHVGVIGATSLVGRAALAVFSEHFERVSAYSRRPQAPSEMPNVQWKLLFPPGKSVGTDVSRKSEDIPCWLCAAPLWILPDYFPMLEEQGARRVVALSSTSRFTKTTSASKDEKATALKLIDGEQRLQQWAERQGIEWVILRPTLIYGFGRDKNISELALLICRFRFFPLPGPSNGLRQPVHASDIATACLAALKKTKVANRAYNLSGGETLTYREMVSRIFESLGLRPRFLTMSPSFIYMLQMLLKAFLRYRHWNTSMVDRLNADLVFDHSDAARDLDFSPRAFRLTRDDLPLSKIRF